MPYDFPDMEVSMMAQAHYKTGSMIEQDLTVKVSNCSNLIMRFKRHIIYDDVK